MNRAIFETFMKTEPQDRLIFINDDITLCSQIIAAGRQSLFINRDETSDSYFTLDTFHEYMWSIVNTGSNMRDYVFVLACYRKNLNGSLGTLLNEIQLLKVRTDGWKLFLGKEYLANTENREDLKEALLNYEKKITGPSEEIKIKDQFHLTDKYGNPRRVNDMAIVEYLIKELDMFVFQGILYIYEGGYFKEDLSGIKVKNYVQTLLYKEFIKSTTLNQIYNLLIIQESLIRPFSEINNYPNSWVNFKNGMYDVKSNVLHKHRVEYYSINQIPHNMNMNFNIDMDWNFTNNFLNSVVVGQDDKRMLLEYFGYCMTKDTSQQKFMILKGTGGTGKSRLIHLLEMILGTENYSNISLQDLNKRFYATNLFCKLLNSCADIPSDAMESTDVIKKATGEDSLMYEKKGHDPVTFKSYSKLLFSANRVPLNLDEKSDAYYRRLLIFEMNKKPKKKDYELDVKLLEEIEGTIAACMKALHDMYVSESGELESSINSDRLVSELHNEADSVRAFIGDCTIRKVDGKIKKDIFFERYKEYCEENERTIYKKTIFYGNVKEKGIQEKIIKGTRYFSGVVFLDEEFMPVDKSTKIPFRVR
jgi:phage/plasmid primase, P4 family, C-terminal domain